MLQLHSWQWAFQDRLLMRSLNSKPLLRTRAARKSSSSRNSLFPRAGRISAFRILSLKGRLQGAENIKFKFGGLQIDGASAYTTEQLSSLYKGKIGTEISLADLYAIAHEMTLKYRNDGYLLTQVVVPPQTIENGIARLQIVEGFVDNVIIQTDEGEGSFLVDTIRSYASYVNAGGALNVKDMERGLLLINDLPGVKARSILSPSKTTPGGADMLIIVERDPYDALITADDFGSRYLGPVQFGAAGSANSWLGLGEAVTGQVVVAPDGGHELAYGALSYEQPIGPWGTKIKAFGSLTDTDPGYDLRQFEVRGHSSTMGIQVEHPFVRSRAFNLAGRAVLDWRNVKSSNNAELTRKDHIRAARVGAKVDFLDTLLGVAVNAFDVELSQGLDIMGASDEGDANLTRAAGDPKFTKLKVQAQRLQRIVEDVNLFLAGSGQWADGPLLSAEEFAVGGINSVRGFDPSEIVGDHGVSGKAELQWNNPGKFDMEYIDKYQLFGFFDAGRTWDEDATTSSAKHDTLTATGGGLRVSFSGATEAGLVVAFPLNRDVQTQNDQDPKVYFNLSKSF